MVGQLILGTGIDGWGRCKRQSFMRDRPCFAATGLVSVWNYRFRRGEWSCEGEMTVQEFPELRQCERIARRDG